MVYILYHNALYLHIQTRSRSESGSAGHGGTGQGESSEGEDFTQEILKEFDKEDYYTEYDYGDGDQDFGPVSPAQTDDEYSQVCIIPSLDSARDLALKCLACLFPG